MLACTHMHVPLCVLSALRHTNFYISFVSFSSVSIPDVWAFLLGNVCCSQWCNAACVKHYFFNGVKNIRAVQLMHCGVWSAVWCCGDLASSGTSARSSPMRSTTGWILTSPLATMEIATTGGSCVAGGRLCEHTQVIFQGSAVGHQRVTSISMEEERLSQRKIESKLLVLVMLSQTI